MLAHHIGWAMGRSMTGRKETPLLIISLIRYTLDCHPQCIGKDGVSFIALVRVRHVEMVHGRWVAGVISINQVPESRYIRSIPLPPTLKPSNEAKDDSTKSGPPKPHSARKTHKKRRRTL